MTENQFDFKPYTPPKQNLNVFLIICGVVFAIAVIYFSLNERKDNNEVLDNNNEVINEQPAINDSQETVNANNYDSEIDDNPTYDEINQKEKDDLKQVELGSYIVNGDENGKAYFHNTPDQATQRKAYVITGQQVIIEKIRNGFGYVEFTNSNGVKTYGWLKMNQLILLNH